MKSRKDIVSKGNKKVKNDLVGFEDVLDLLGENAGQKGQVTRDNLSDNFELYHFLEQEVERLKKLNEFWGLQYLAILKNERIDVLIKRQNDANFEIREQLISKLMPHTSPYHLQMKHLWELSINNK